jgi:hypothetical protein
MGKVPFHVSVAACAAMLLPCPVLAATDAEVDALREELARVKAEYAERMAQLEERIGQLRSGPDGGATAVDTPAVGGPSVTPVEAAPVAAARDASAPVARGAATFNPAMSLILAGNYSYLGHDPEDYAIQGFLPAGDEIGPGERSFNLGESELTLSASVDSYFMGSLTAAVTAENEIELEEAYFRTLSLPEGFTLKGGQFFSSLGYLNESHAHTWDFIDQPLVYQAFFGGQMAVQGLQLKWIAPLDVFLELGVETGNGDYFPGTREAGNGLNGVIAYAHVGGDVGDSIAWRGGFSWVDLDAVDREYEDVDASGEDVVNAFTGSSETWVVDAELQWTRPGDPKRRSLKLQGEYLQRREDGSLAYGVTGPSLVGDYSSDQSGWYVQGVYRFLPRWRFGARYDSLDSGDTKIGLVRDGNLSADDFAILLPGTPTRTSLMLDWSPSEFSRLRAQYAWDDASEGPTDEQFFLQYIHALGAHGAHKF